MARKQVDKETNRPTVDIVHPSYQPSAAELREDLRIDTTFDQLADTLGSEVEVNYVKSLPRGAKRRD